MARPIEPTPTLEGEDALRLLRDLQRGCSPDEAKRRIDLAKVELAALKRPKGSPDDRGPLPGSTRER